MVVAEVEPRALNCVHVEPREPAGCYGRREAGSERRDRGVPAWRAVIDLPIMNQGCFAWAATETHAVRAIHLYLVEGRRFDQKLDQGRCRYWQRTVRSAHSVVVDELRVRSSALQDLQTMGFITMTPLDF